MSNDKVLIQTVLDKSKIKSELKEIQKIINKHPVYIFSELKADSLKKQVATAAQNIKKEMDKVTSTSLSFKPNIEETLDSSKTIVKGMLDTIKGTVQSNISNYVTTDTTIGDSIKKIVTESIALNKSLVSLQQVTGYTNYQTKELLDTYIKTGKQMGISGKEIANNATSWIKQGNNIQETNSLIKNSMLLAKVGQLETAESTKYLTNIMQGHKLSVEEVTDVVDKLTAVDLKTSIDTSSITAAMSMTAQSAHLAGVNMDNLIGYLATVGEVSRQEMSSVGESFHSIFSRYSNMKLGNFVDESGGDISSEIHNAENLLNRVGVSLTDVKGRFKDFDSVMSDIASKWNSFTGSEQNSLANLFADSGHSENFITLMENYGNALEYAGIAADSSGTALQRFETYSNGIEASLNRFGASFESLSMTMVNDNFLSTIIDTGSGAIGVLEKVISLLGTFGTLTTIGAGIASSKGLGKTNFKVYNALSYKVA